MLDEARAVLGDRVRYVVADLGDPLPDGPWDAVVSALAVHHLDDAGKRALFGRLHAALTPGGVFVNAEQVGAPSALFRDLYAGFEDADCLFKDHCFAVFVARRAPLQDPSGP